MLHANLSKYPTGLRIDVRFINPCLRLEENQRENVLGNFFKNQAQGVVYFNI
jgi:hypothetical protein